VLVAGAAEAAKVIVILRLRLRHAAEMLKDIIALLRSQCRGIRHS